MVLKGNGAIQVIQLPVTAAVARPELPKLLDAKGQPFILDRVPSSNTRVNGGQVSVNATLVYRPQPGQGDPSQLVYHGQQQVSFQVPFAFKNVPLPGAD